jgi:hypothetical protein
LADAFGGNGADLIFALILNKIVPPKRISAPAGAPLAAQRARHPSLAQSGPAGAGAADTVAMWRERESSALASLPEG